MTRCELCDSVLTVIHLGLNLHNIAHTPEFCRSATLHRLRTLERILREQRVGLDRYHAPPAIVPRDLIWHEYLLGESKVDMAMPASCFEKNQEHPRSACCVLCDKDHPEDCKCP